jgi:membrane-associated phospholipid phosphatase
VIDACYNLAGNIYLDKLMLGISWFGNGVWIPVALTLLAGITFWFFGKKHFAIAIVLAPLVGNIVKSGLKELVRRPRPGWEGCQSLVTLKDYSFPSGHTVFYTIFFGLLFWYGYKFLKDKWCGKVMYILPGIMFVLVGISRVYLGAHWITDVLAGYAIGAIILAVTIYLLNKYPDKN